MNRLLFLFLFLPVVAGAQIITTVAGTGTRGDGSDGGPASVAELNQPSGIAIDEAGTIYFIDAGNENISKITADGIIHILVGIHEGHRYNPAYGYNGDGGPATNAVVWKPQSIVAGQPGDIYFGDYENSVIREVSSTGTINTIAGFPQKSGNDNSLAVLNRPGSLTFNIPGNLYFADVHNNMVRRIGKDGSITTIAGTGEAGYSGDGGPAIDAQLNKPWCTAADDSGNVFIADTYNNVVRKVNTAGIISTYAGNGVAGYSGDGGPASAAQINSPHGIATDKAGNLYITDVTDNVIRRVDADGIISTFAGNGHRGYSGDKGMATNAQLNLPSDVALDAAGNVYIADGLNHVIRKVTPSSPVKKEMPVKDAFNVSADIDNEVLIVTIDSGAYTSFTITDLSGKIILQQSIDNIQTRADISLLQPGRYYINLKKENKVKTAMFVKDK